MYGYRHAECRIQPNPQIIVRHSNQILLPDYDRCLRVQQPTMYVRNYSQSPDPVKVLDQATDRHELLVLEWRMTPSEL